MEATTSLTPMVECCNIAEDPVSPSSSLQTFDKQVRHFTSGEFPLAATPCIVLHVLTSCDFDPQDLAKLEATCSFFRRPANFAPDHSLSISELAAFDLCHKRAIFRAMTTDQRDDLKKNKCGGSWKLVLRYLLSGEVCCRREKSQAIAGLGHSIVVTSKGQVYCFGSNKFGQLGHGPTPEEDGVPLKNEFHPRLIRSLQGIRIIQAAAGAGRTMLVSDAGKVYSFGKEVFGESEYGAPPTSIVNTPRMVESLKDTFIVQVAIGNLFTAVLSREGRVYTFCWGSYERLGHNTDSTDLNPHPLLGELENRAVVQIAADFCYLLALAYEPGGMSVYSVGCGYGGKLGHASTTTEKKPRLIQEFGNLNMQPWVISAGSWHSAVIAKDGRVCTWGWGHYGCLGHGNVASQSVPKVVEALIGVKAVHVSTGEYTTSVVSQDGSVYSFGLGQKNNVPDDEYGGVQSVTKPVLVRSLTLVKDPVVQMSSTNSTSTNAHTFALTESGKLYAFGGGKTGQLGVKLKQNQMERWTPELVDLDLN